MRLRFLFWKLIDVVERTLRSDRHRSIIRVIHVDAADISQLRTKAPDLQGYEMDPHEAFRIRRLVREILGRDLSGR